MDERPSLLERSKSYRPVPVCGCVPTCVHLSPHPGVSRTSGPLTLISVFTCEFLQALFNYSVHYAWKCKKCARGDRGEGGYGVRIHL